MATMDSVIFNGPYDLSFEKRPKPELRDPTDAIVKVTLAGVCGSELHMYRGVMKTDYGQIMGHEFVGIVEAVGSEVHSVKPGDRVVCIFSTACGLSSCWFCSRGYSVRCPHALTFGTTLRLDGGQAEYVRVPFADGTLQLPSDDMTDELLVFMCDVFPTGFYGAKRAIEGLEAQTKLAAETFGKPESFDKETLPLSNGHSAQQTLDDAVFVCIGCGPVGLCSILTAKSKGVKTLYAVDSVDDRLKEAEEMGAIPLKVGRDDINKYVLEASGGRGADAVIEVVGNPAALRSAFDMLRPCGVLSSIGAHQEELPFSGLECYGKNINVNFGRAPVRAVFREALECLRANKEKFASFVTHRLPLSQAVHAFEIFEKQQARKIVLIPGS